MLEHVGNSSLAPDNWPAVERFIEYMKTQQDEVANDTENVSKIYDTGAMASSVAPVLQAGNHQGHLLPSVGNSLPTYPGQPKANGLDGHSPYALASLLE